MLYLSAAPNTASECSEQSAYPPLVVVAISAANTLLLLISLTTFIASCAVLRRAKKSQNDRFEDTVHDYEVVDDVVKFRMVQADMEAVSVCDNVGDLSHSTHPQYQDLQTHTTDNHQYATVTICTTQWQKDCNQNEHMYTTYICGNSVHIFIERLYWDRSSHYLWQDGNCNLY